MNGSNDKAGLFRQIICQAEDSHEMPSLNNNKKNRMSSTILPSTNVLTFV